MNGDFSRFTFAPDRRYDRVLMQQGRLQTDADWNEQAAIHAQRHQIALQDIIGRSGVPRDRAGFGIRGHGGLVFDGSRTYVEIDAPNPRPLHSSFTIEGWIKVTDSGKRATLISRLVSTSGAPGGFRLGLTAHNRLRFERVEQHQVEIAVILAEEGLSDDDRLEEIAVLDDRRIAVRRAVSHRPLETGRYVHVAAVCDHAQVQLFLDGTLDRTVRSGEGAAFDTSAFVIGCDRVDGQSQHHFAGAIDRLRLWNTPLEAEDVKHLADDRPIERLLPLCHWHFGSDEHLVLDLGGHHHHSRKSAGDALHLPTAAEPEIWIGPGRCYVDGVASEIAEPTRFDQQAQLPGAQLPSSSARSRYPGPYLLYLDSWDRVVTASEDANLTDPALGGLDTAARLQIVSQVQIVESGAVETAMALHRQTGTLKIQRTAGVPLAMNRLLRVEIHESGYPQGMPVPPTGQPIEGLELSALDPNGTVKLAHGGVNTWRPGRLVELVRPGLAKPLNGTVRSASTDHDGSTKLHLTLDGTTALKGDASQWRLRPIASFKWSQDNGATQFPVSDIGADGLSVTVRNGADRQGLLAAWDWVELIDDRTVLRRQPGPLARIQELDDGDFETLVLALGAAVPDPFHRTVDARLADRPQLRRWDAIDLPDGPAGQTTLGMEASVKLDAGIEIQFGPGLYKAGDYWTLATRVQWQWPADKDGLPRFMPSEAGEHRLAPLAIVWFRGSSVEVRDLRRVFSPLTDPGPAEFPIQSGAAADAPEPMIAEVEQLLQAPADEALERAEQSAPGTPAGQSILTRSHRSPQGWTPDGAQLAIPQLEPEWVPAAAPLPFETPYAATELDGEIFCFASENRLYRLDLAVGEWERRSSVPEGSFSVAGATAHGGHMHVLGSVRDGRGMLHYSYDPAADSWTSRAPLPEARTRFGLATLKGQLYVAGGLKDGSRRLLEQVEIYEPDRDRWRSHTALPHPTAGAALAAVQGRLYLVGGLVSRNLGISHQVTNQVAVFSPGTGKWTERSPLEFARSGALLAVTDRRLHIMGGVGADGHAPPDEMLDLATGTWVEAPQPRQRHAGGAAAVTDGTIYRFGTILGLPPTFERCIIERVLHVHSRLE